MHGRDRKYHENSRKKSNDDVRFTKCENAVIEKKIVQKAAGGRCAPPRLLTWQDVFGTTLENISSCQMLRAPKRQIFKNYVVITIPKEETVLSISRRGACIAQDRVHSSVSAYGLCVGEPHKTSMIVIAI